MNDYVSFTPISSKSRTQAGWFNFSRQASSFGNLQLLFDNLWQHNANDYIYICGTSDLFYWKPSLNTWYYLVFTFSDNSIDSNAKLYVNAVPYGITIQGGGDIDGVSGLSGSWFSFGGQISNVSTYNRSLSSAEITQNFNATKGRYGL